MKSSFVNFLAYLALGLVAVALLVQYILTQMDVGPNVVSIISAVAQATAYFVAAAAAFGYARSKKSIAYTIFYIVALLVVIIFLFLNVKI